MIIFHILFYLAIINLRPCSEFVQRICDEAEVVPRKVQLKVYSVARPTLRFWTADCRWKAPIEDQRTQLVREYPKDPTPSSGSLEEDTSKRYLIWEGTSWKLNLILSVTSFGGGVAFRATCHFFLANHRAIGLCPRSVSRTANPIWHFLSKLSREQPHAASWSVRSRMGRYCRQHIASTTNGGYILRCPTTSRWFLPSECPRKRANWKVNKGPAYERMGVCNAERIRGIFLEDENTLISCLYNCIYLKNKA